MVLKLKMGKEGKKGVEGKLKNISILNWGEKSLAINYITGILSLCKSLFCFHVILRLHHTVARAVLYLIINKSLA
jgi:hypothetical protein